MNGLLGIISATAINQDNDRPISGSIGGLLGSCSANAIQIVGDFTQAAFIENGQFRAGILRVYSGGEWKETEVSKFYKGRWR